MFVFVCEVVAAVDSIGGGGVAVVEAVVVTVLVLVVVTAGASAADAVVPDSVVIAISFTNCSTVFFLVQLLSSVAFLRC